MDAWCLFMAHLSTNKRYGTTPSSGLDQKTGSHLPAQSRNEVRTVHRLHSSPPDNTHKEMRRPVEPSVVMCGSR